MLFAQAMLEAILTVTVRAADTRVFESIDEGFAGDMIALVGVIDVWFLWRGAILLLGCSVAPARPFTSMTAFMGGFASVIKAESASTGFAAKWEEI